MPNQSIDITLQPAGEDHIPAMAALWAEAFPEKPVERRDRELREGLVFGDLSDCWIVEHEGRIAGALRTYRLTTHLWGHTLPTMGLAGVAVAPDFRRRGIGRRMCVEALKMARDRGDVLSALYPFRTSFYRDLGYVLGGEFHRYRFQPAELGMYPGWDRVERAPDTGRAEAREIYEQVAGRSNGLLTRTERMWSFLNRQGTYLYLHRNPRGVPTGYIVVRGRGGAPERSRLRVLELVAQDREAYLGLLGWLSVQRDQWGRITYDALPGEKFHRRLAHPRTASSAMTRGLWFHSAAVLRGPMFRIVNLESVLSRDGDAGPPPMGTPDAWQGPMQVRDTVLPGNQGQWADGVRVDAALSSTRNGVLSIGEVTTLLLDGRLPGQVPPPEGWTPNLGLSAVRLLDEF
jgi:predicted acetyltransferase